MRRGNQIQLLFTERPPGTHYREGHWSWVNDRELREEKYIEKGYAVEWNPETDNLPDDLPGKQAFQQAGYNDIDVVKNLADWDAVPGIGQVTEQKLVEYFNAENN